MPRATQRTDELKGVIGNGSRVARIIPSQDQYGARARVQSAKGCQSLHEILALSLCIALRVGIEEQTISALLA